MWKVSVLSIPTWRIEPRAEDAGKGRIRDDETKRKGEFEEAMKWTRNAHKGEMSRNVM